MSADEHTYLLDTQTAHTLLQANAPVPLRDRIRQARFGSLWMSAVTEGELRGHLSDLPPLSPRREALELLCRNVPTIPFDRSAALAYGRLRQHPALPPNTSDLQVLVTAHAISLGATLITADARFVSIAELTIENWHRA
jgi:predicted nucleic acid-binding protein